MMRRIGVAKRGTDMNRVTLSYYASISAAVAVIIVVVGAWLITLPRGPGAPEIGREGLLMPVGLVGIVAAWLALRLLLLRGVGWTLPAVLGASAVLAYLVTAALFGPVDAFKKSPSHYAAWFLIPGAVLAAVVTHLSFTGLQPGKADGAT